MRNWTTVGFMLIASTMGAQQRASGASRFSVELTPTVISLRGKDYKGIKSGFGVQLGAHLQFGLRSLGMTYRQSGHDPDLGLLDVDVSGLSAGLKLKGVVFDFRQEMNVDPSAKVVPYGSAEFGLFKQTIGASAGSLSVDFDANGFGGGGGIGVLYHATPVIDLLGQVDAHLLGFQAFDLPNDAGAGSEIVGYDIGIRLGLRARLGGAR